MRTIGGITCDEEFGLFLAARPDYVAYGNLPSDPSNNNQFFTCSDGGLRRYYIPIVIPDCDVALAEFLRENPQFVETTLMGQPEQNPRTRVFVCPVSGLARYYGYTPAGNFQRLLDYLRRDTRSDGLTEEGRIFFESEKPSDFTLEEYYAFAARQVFYVRRLFAADGSYVLFLRKGSRYHRDFPQFIISV